MFLVVVLIIFAIIATFLDTSIGKVVIGSAVAAIGLLLLSWITGVAFFITLAKVCAIIIVVGIVGAILYSIFSK